jgi:hypothetical protein
MSFDGVASGEFTSAAGVNPVTGVGFRPRAVFFLVTKHAANGFNNDLSWCVGWSVEDIDQVGGDGIKDVCSFRTEDDANDPVDYNSGASTTSSIRWASPTWTGATTRLVGTVQNLNNDGFDVNFTTHDTTETGGPWRVRWVAFDSMAFSRVDFTNFNGPGTPLPKSVNYDHFAWQPDVLMQQSFTSLGLATAALEQGMANWGTQGQNRAAPQDSIRTFRTDSIIHRTKGQDVSTPASRYEDRAEFAAMRALGFQLDWQDDTDADGSTSTNFIIAMKGGSHKVGTAQQPAVSGSQSLSVGFRPNFSMMVSAATEFADTLTEQRHARSAIGVSGGGNSYARALTLTDAVTPTSVVEYNGDEALALVDRDNPAILDAGAALAFGNDGAGLTWTVNDSSQRYFAYWLAAFDSYFKRAVTRYDAVGAYLNGSAVSPNGRWLIVADGTGGLESWDFDTATGTWASATPTDTVAIPSATFTWQVAFNPAGTYVATTTSHAGRVAAVPFDEATGLFGTPVQNGDTAPATPSQGFQWHPNGGSVFVGFDGVVPVGRLFWNGSAFTGWAVNPSDLTDFDAADTTRGIAVTNGAVIINYETSVLAAYQLTGGGFGSRYTNGTVTGGPIMWDMKVNSDESMVAVGSNLKVGGAHARAWSWNDATGFGSQINLGTIPHQDGTTLSILQYVNWHPVNPARIAVATNEGFNPFVAVYDIVGGVVTDVWSAPQTRAFEYGYSVEWLGDGTYLAVEDFTTDKWLTLAFDPSPPGGGSVALEIPTASLVMTPSTPQLLTLTVPTASMVLTPTAPEMAIEIPTASMLLYGDARGGNGSGGTGGGGPGGAPIIVIGHPPLEPPAPTTGGGSGPSLVLQGAAPTVTFGTDIGRTIPTAQLQLQGAAPAVIAGTVGVGGKVAKTWDSNAKHSPTIVKPITIETDGSVSKRTDITAADFLFAREQKVIAFDCEDVDGDPVNMTGWALEFAVKRNVDAQPVELQANTASGISIGDSPPAPDGNGGTGARALVTVPESFDPTPGSLDYGFWRTDSGQRAVLAHGEFVVLRAPTS